MSQPLYNFLSEQGDYTKSYEDFQTQFASPDSVRSLYNIMYEIKIFVFIITIIYIKLYRKIYKSIFGLFPNHPI